MPSFVLVSAFAIGDWALGSQHLWRAVVIGALGGLAAAIAYDLFRLPFVLAASRPVESIIPALPLFKVFPRFGAMILGQPIEQAHYSIAAQVIGWAYHFSNGITLGILYMAAIGNAQKRHWTWAVVLAVGLELGMLSTPYSSVFGVAVTRTFILVTLIAHVIFGIVLGVSACLMAKAWE